MEESLENKLEFKNRIINFYNDHKVKVITIIFILIFVFISLVFFENKKEKNNIITAEKYIEAGLDMASGKKENAKVLYEEIILSKNKFYSILALNSVLEKNLINDKETILKYFKILEKIKYSKEEADLIKFKKALYLLQNNDQKIGNDLLRKLIEENSNLKRLAQEIMIK
tara:strand:+ start:177 stop:686 length:510 start_codon:yes stop_codon:yes gene_type:complete